jgi:hypothetical protein
VERSVWILISFIILNASWWSNIVGLWGASNAISEWSSIIGFGITTYLLITTNGIKDKMQRVIKFKDFKKDKKSLINDLNSSINLMITNPTDPNNATDLIKILRKLQDYKSYMTKEDKKALSEARKIVSKGITTQNSNVLRTLLASLVGFLEIKQEYDINNL